MKLLAFTIFDEKSGAFGHPFFVPAVGLATRTFSDWCNNPKTPVGLHPEDYRLYQVGDWDDGSAKFTNLEVMRLVGTGTDYLEVKSAASS